MYVDEALEEGEEQTEHAPAQKEIGAQLADRGEVALCVADRGMGECQHTAPAPREDVMGPLMVRHTAEPDAHAEHNEERRNERGAMRHDGRGGHGEQRE